MAQEARLEDSGSGLTPVSDGWFVVNVRDATWLTSEAFGATCPFEGPEAWFRQLGIRIKVLQPGQPNCLYHRENLQEDFLVLAGECLLLVDEQERPLRTWDFFHCPPGTDHVFVGAGNGPCVILMAGARSEDEELFYPVSELARRYGASADEATASPEQAYERFAESRPARPDSWRELPWS